jgi:hypothetical protein
MVGEFLPSKFRRNVKLVPVPHNKWGKIEENPGINPTIFLYKPAHKSGPKIPT